MKEAYTNAQLTGNIELKDTLILTTGDIGRYFCSGNFYHASVFPFSLGRFCMQSVYYGISVFVYDVFTKASALNLRYNFHILFLHKLSWAFLKLHVNNVCVVFFIHFCKGSEGGFRALCAPALVALFVVQIAICVWSSIYRNTNFGCFQVCKAASPFQSVQEPHMSGKDC